MQEEQLEVLRLHSLQGEVHVRHVLKELKYDPEKHDVQLFGLLGNEHVLQEEWHIGMQTFPTKEKFV